MDTTPQDILQFLTLEGDRHPLLLKYFNRPKQKYKNTEFLLLYQKLVKGVPAVEAVQTIQNPQNPNKTMSYHTYLDAKNFFLEVLNSNEPTEPEEKGNKSVDSDIFNDFDIVLENLDLYSFYTQKITQWKGNYPRIFSVGTHGIATYSPNDGKKTNYWQWTDVYNLSPLSTPDHPNQFQLVHRKGKGTDSMKFESEHRAHILTLCLQQEQHGAFSKSHQTENIDRAILEFRNLKKHRWGQDFTSQFQSIVATCVSVDQISLEGERKSYFFKDIDCILELKEEPNVFALQMKETNRLHIFLHPERSKVTSRIKENSNFFLGLTLNSTTLDNDTLSDLLEKRLGIYSDDQHITSLSEFAVQNCRRSRILLCLSETCLIERDPATYCISSLFPLSTVFALVRCNDDSQAVLIEFTSGSVRTYFSTERDSLLSSLMDGARASGNCSVHVKSKITPQGKRWGPLCSPVDEKVESLFLKFIHQPHPAWTFTELLIRFNANVQYSGLIHSVTQEKFFAEKKEKLILVALNALLVKDINLNDYEEYFHLVRRIACSKTGFGAFAEMLIFREKVGNTVVTALKNSMSDCVIYAALDVMAALMQPMHSEADLRQEQENKEKILNSPKFLESLLDMWTSHVKKGTGALVTMAMLDILTFALCAPYSETTLRSHFDSLLKAVSQRGHVLFTLFQHPSVAIVKGASLVMKALIEEGQGTIGREMQDMALKEGALIRHLLNAFFLQTNDPLLLTLRQLSRHLVSLWTCQNPVAMELLQRILPSGLLRFLESTETVQYSETDRINTRDNLKLATAAHRANQPSQFAKQVRNVEKYVEKQVEVALKHWRLKTAQEVRTKNQLRPVALRKRRQILKVEGNWQLLYHKFMEDHALPDLIWNYPVREELREALQNETKLLDGDRDHVVGEICWNHADFQVQYNSLNEEINIGGYYLRLLLEEESLASSFVIRNPKEFFANFSHISLLTDKADMRGLFLKAMTTVYGRYWEEIGVYGDLKYVVLMLDKCCEKTERDRILLFIQKLVLCRENARELVNCGGLRVLVDLLSLAHLHTSRAVVPTQTNVIEASADMMHADFPEWHYQPQGSNKKVGPVGFLELKKLYHEGKIDGRTECWAMGLDTWRQFQSIPQLKWFIIAEKQTGMLNEFSLATVILDILIQVVSFCPARNGDAVIRPFPKAKQILSDTTSYLSHIVQLLLTFDPSIVEKVVQLLNLVLDENPMISRVYTTGVFFFIMMYNGSNILPVSRFLKLTHLKQNTYYAQQGGSVWQKSVLGPLLPEAMIAYLENHGVEKFSEIFLGEFDTPDAIWSSSMRRHLIERIARHVADFSLRLMSNTRTLYEYCAIPAITYETLETELFCNVFYLRNLTDETRFPDWTINDPLYLLRDVLETWKNEVEKKPPPMTVTDALKALELEGDTDWSDNVKKNYRKLTQKYHPDKNPEGRERFEEANRAYEFLCSRYSTESTNPEPNRIVLILRCQSILFKRYGYVLEPYKYDGYPMLIKTMEMEVADDALFAKETPLLGASTELVYHTLNCSALNVEELRREKGLDLLLRAFDRCVSVISKSSKMSDIGPQVCMHVTRCFTVATKFQLCRDKLVEMPQLSQDICRVLYFKHLTNLSCVAAEAITAMSVDTILQMHLLQAGTLWHLLMSLFQYDFTLEEAGVAANEETNQQILTNKFAKLSIIALRSLCGDGESNPRNDVIRASLDSLLMPYGANMVREKEPEVILKILNENCTTPYLIWNNKARNELLEFCDIQLSLLRNGDIADMTYGSDFTYTLHKGELVIGSIFVRVYNSEPTFVLENSPEFVNELLIFLSNNDPTSRQNTPDDISKITQCVEALSNVLKNNTGCETLFKGKFRLLTRYLMCPLFEQRVLSVLTCLMANQTCVADIVGMGIVPALLVVSASAQQDAVIVITAALNCLSMIVTHPIVVKEAIQKGIIVYLIDFFCTNNIDPLIRQKSSEVLSKLCADKLSGPRVKILLSKFLPSIFFEAMAESPQSALQRFDSVMVIENPEILWNETSRSNVIHAIREMKQDLFISQRSDLSVDWKLPSETFQVDYGVPGELVIGGIYLRIYVTNPSWNLRKPREFLRDLLEYTFSPNGYTSGRKSDENLELVGSALGHLLGAQPHLYDVLPPMGHMKSILQSMESDRSSIKRAACIVLRVLANNHPCVESLCQLDSIQHIVKGMRKKSETLPLTCETLNHIYAARQPELVQQALQCQLIPLLLSLLKSPSDLGPNPAATKAHIVKTLESMSEDERHGEEVIGILSKSEVWAQYRDQKHDLFLSDKPVAGYLTASTGSVADIVSPAPDDSGELFYDAASY